MTNIQKPKIINIFDLFKDLIALIPVVTKGWIQVFKNITISLYSYWNSKILFDKIFFILLFLQLLAALSPWFQYQISYSGQMETIYLGPKLNAVFILVSLLNFFFLGFWKAAWTRVWFFATEILAIVFVIWGYIDPKKYYYEFVNPNEIHYTWIFFGFISLLFFTTISGYLTFQKEDEIFS